MTVGGCWPALVLGKYDPVSWDGLLYFCREGEKATCRGAYRLNCFIAALLRCSIRLFPERITPCALSTHQVQHCLMKRSAAPSAMAFRKPLSLQKYKLVLVLTIEMAGTALPNKFICIEVCRTDLPGYNEGHSRTPLEPRQHMFNIPPEPSLTGRGGPAHTLFPLSGTQKLECVLMQMPTTGICSLLQNCEVCMGVPSFGGKQQLFTPSINSRLI